MINERLMLLKIFLCGWMCEGCDETVCCQVCVGVGFDFWLKCQYCCDVIDDIEMDWWMLKLQLVLLESFEWMEVCVCVIMVGIELLSCS